MGRHQYINEDEYEVNLKDFEPQPGIIIIIIIIDLCSDQMHRLQMDNCPRPWGGAWS